VRAIKYVPWAAVALVAAACSSSGWGTSGGDTDEAAKDPGLVWTARAYPTGNKRTSAVLVERGMPAEVQSGQRYDYELRVTNLTELPITNVVLTDTAPEGFSVPEGALEAQVEGGVATWNLGDLAGGAEVSVRAGALAGAPGSFTHTCQVHWEAPLAGVTTIVQPELALTRTVPEVVVLADGVPVTYEVSNVGTGTARDVVIEETLPAGFTIGEGETAVRIEVGALPAGEKRSYTKLVRASGTGAFGGTAVATGFGGLRAETEPASVQVTQPVLRANVAAPARAAIGQVYTVGVTVGNAGDGPARDTRVQLTIPVGTSLVSGEPAEDTGMTVAGENVQWELGTIDPGTERTVSVKLRADQAMAIQQHVLVTAHGADDVVIDSGTELYGIATVNVELRDEVDPIQVGGQAVYLVRVVNQGTAPATNLKLVCTLEEGMSLVEAGGASAGSGDGAQITFEPVATLAPKAAVSWRVVVRADQPGDRRFTVAVTSDQLDRPVEAAESTRFFE